MEHHLRTLAVRVHRLAEEVFGELDAQLEPVVLLAAVVADEGAWRSVLVGPDALLHDPQVLAGAVEIVAAQADPELAQPPGEGGAAAAADVAWETDDLLAQALGKAFAAEETRTGRVAFVAPLRALGRARVAPVLTLQSAIFHSYYALRRRTGEGGSALATSLLDATVAEVLQATAATVSEYRPGPPPGAPTAGPDEILRAAGRRLMQVPAYAAGNLEGQEFFQVCDLLSAQRYEGGEGRGRMVVAARGHPDVETVLDFHTPVDLEDHRGVRKVLELTGADLCLLTDASQVFGLGRVAGAYERAAESLFVVHVRAHGTWELSHANAVLMRVVNGRPRLPHGELDEDEFRLVLARAFGHLEPRRFEDLLAIAIQAIHQRRGTTVVISAGAAEEAVRLGSQALRIRPVPLTPATVPLVTAIDGAVLVDPAGVCHALGVILDGRASRRGDPARGARFNSAVRYVDGGEHRAVALVISEEGTVDLIGPA